MTNAELIELLKKEDPNKETDLKITCGMTELVPLVRGKWVSEIVEAEDWKGSKRKYFQSTSCSVCHKPSAMEFDYCPHCGAKMESIDETTD